MSFPELILAAMIVAAGIYALDQFSPTAAWLLTILILMTIAFRYQSFADELNKLAGLLSVSSGGGNQQTNPPGSGGFNPDPGAIGSIQVH